MIHLFLVRHGQTDSNRLQRICGHDDAPLNDEGRNQARLLGYALDDLKLDWVYTSNLQRARETAALILGQHKIGLPPDRFVITELLQEKDFGPREGEVVAAGYSISARYAHCFADDGGEPIAGVERRARQFLQMVLTLHPGQCVMVVSHGFFNCCLTATILGKPVMLSTIYPQMNTGVNYFLLDDNGMVRASKLNTIAHLLPGCKLWALPWPEI
jgi:broad specificity phosphatase PhoE